MPVASDEDLAPLAGIVVPFPSRQAQAVKAVRLGPRDALLLLVRFPRILGWKDSATLRLQFNQLADLVATVPVFTANVPWGPPFEDQVAVDLLALAHDPIRPSIPGLPGP